MLGFAPQASAASGSTSGQPGTVKPGVAGNKAQHPKLDQELTNRAEHQDPNALTSTIVRLQPDAKLPAQFKLYQGWRQAEPH